MSWLRVDDRFTSHPKFEGWPVVDRWAFLELMTYCARYRTRGRVPDDLSLLPRNVTEKLLRKAEKSGWIESRNGSRFIHDFEVYNPADPTGAERQKRLRDRRSRDDRNGDRNDERNGEDRYIDRDDDVTVTDPRARARARGPVPSPRESFALSHDVTLDDFGEDARRQAWIDRSFAPDVRSPAAFVRAGMASGEWPDPYVEAERPDEPRAVNAPVTAERCPECDVAPPNHAADCSRRRS